MSKPLALFLLPLLFIITQSRATTWDEPWADQVIKGSSSFVLAKVNSCDPEKGISIKIIKSISGKVLKDSLTINGFSLLHLCSSSGHGVEFHTEPIDSCYFFISQDKEGHYCIATPTTGFDYVYEGKVISTYRHSYHKAPVPVSVYEKTMTAIFNNFHHLPYDENYINNFVRQYLALAPAGFAEDEIQTFFMQHVALECVHYLRLKIDESMVLPFLRDKNNFHSQISAARAMVAFNSNSSKQELLNFIGDATQRNFVKVICIQTLSELQTKEIKPQLEKLAKTASNEDDGFGGNIMDPRICTHLPTVKEALNELISK